MGTWENMLCLKEALIKIGPELFEGIEFPFKYNIQNHTKFENIFSIHKIVSPELGVKTLQIKCKRISNYLCFHCFLVPLG